MRARGLVISVLAAVALGYGFGAANHGGTADAAPAKPVTTASAKPATTGLTAWRHNLRAEGFTRLSRNPFPKHGECWAVIPDGDTAVVVCRDGYAATS